MLLRSALDPGEAKAIALFLERKPEGLLPIDDRRGRRTADERSIPIVGSAGVLLTAKDRGPIPAVGPPLDDVRTAGLHFGDGVASERLSVADERPSETKRGEPSVAERSGRTIGGPTVHVEETDKIATNRPVPAAQSHSLARRRGPACRRSRKAGGAGRSNDCDGRVRRTRHRAAAAPPALPPCLNRHAEIPPKRPRVSVPRSAGNGIRAGFPAFPSSVRLALGRAYLEGKSAQRPEWLDSSTRPLASMRTWRTRSTRIVSCSTR